MEATVSKKLLTVDEYYKMAEVGILKPADRVELINGEIIERMSPVGSRHAGISKILNAVVRRCFGEKYVVSVQDPIGIDNRSEPEPDLALLNHREDRYLDAHPNPQDIVVVVEIVDSSLSYDRGVKKELYARARIPIYWIINLVDSRVEVYTKPKLGQYSKEKFFIIGDVIELLGAEIPVAEILE